MGQSSSKLCGCLKYGKYDFFSKATNATPINYTATNGFTHNDVSQNNESVANGNKTNNGKI